MKYFLILVFCVVSGSSVAFAITAEEVVELTQLKTSDEAMELLIRDSPLTNTLTPAQVIQLKKDGVSERILSLLLGTVSDSSSSILPRQDSKSYWLDGSARYYYTTASDGTKKMVVTNLDENGKRMGPPPPPPAPKQPEMQTSEIPAVQSVYEAPTQWPQDHERQFERVSRYRDQSDSLQYDERFSFQYPNFYPAAGFIPDYPGSTFGFHLFPRFTFIRIVKPASSFPLNCHRVR